ncbi:MAG: hypothetical protein N2Z73_04680 [Endomicrobia bacterium]|nr:hypothetical protein [Endomicrobiia bacterium]
MLNKIKKSIPDLFLIVLAKQIKKQLNLKEDKPGMIDKKEWYKSKTVWAGIITILITVYNTARPVVIENFGINLPEIPGWVYTILGALGIYGRVSAKNAIK